MEINGKNRKYKNKLKTNISKNDGNYKFCTVAVGWDNI
jgi:hypothetical protein